MRSRSIARFCILAGIVLCLPYNVSALDRLALIIGNADYPDAPLRNPVNDAEAMERRLRALGFETIALEDASRRQMAQAIQDFAARLNRDTTGLFFYAGHGIQAKGRNYLIPIDAELTTERALRFEAIEMSGVLEAMEDAENRINVVILDACRNNPFERRFRGRAKGLAAIDAAQGTLIAYATAPGSVADDGDGKNGLYTEELLKALALPGLEAEEVFKRVRISVSEKSAGQQVPWESSSLIGDLVFNLVQRAQSPASMLNHEGLFWDSIRKSKEPAAYEAYLEQFPNGVFADLARIRIERYRLKAAGESTQPTAEIAKFETKEYSSKPETTESKGQDEPDLAKAAKVPAEQLAYLTVRSNVVGDSTIIDGEPKGPTGPSQIALSTGEHTVRVEKPGYEPVEERVTLGPGERRVLRFELGRIGGAAQAPAISTGAVALVAIPKDGRYGSTRYTGSGRKTAQIIANAASRHLGKVTVANSHQSLEQSLDQARTAGYSYLIYPTIKHWEDRNTVWSGRPDKVKVQVEVYNAQTRRIVESEYVEKVGSRWSMGLSGDKPEDLLPPLVDTYFASLPHRLR